ncbi:MAG: ribonuclease HII [Oscillospiraceae bacterium]|nr:ribonuclease HII [Oscillospiraceae bacterium]
MEETNLWLIEQSCFARGVRLVCGADEAGAGPLAGPVYAAAVILPPYLDIPGLDDSKKLTMRQRETLYPIICKNAVAYAVSWAEVEEIDRINILNARLLAMNRAIHMLPLKPNLALIDGNRNTGIDLPSLTIVGGDGKSASIAAASILAKVSRDRYMERMDQVYPGYEFGRHKGYPTRRHYELLREYGPCPLHRRSFLKNL